MLLKGCVGLSGGTGEFEVQQIDKASRGTDIILHLRDDALDYLESYKVKQIVNKYSDHISLPIEMQKKFGKKKRLLKVRSLKAAKWSKQMSGKQLTRQVHYGHVTRVK